MLRAGVYLKMEKCPLTRFGDSAFNRSFHGANWIMKLITHFVRRNIARIVAIAFLVALYLMAQLPGSFKGRT